MKLLVSRFDPNPLRINDPGVQGARPLEPVGFFAQSLAVDEGYRDGDVWKNFLNRYNLPETVSLSAVNSALGGHTGHNYAGDAAVIAKLKTLITPDALAALKRPEVGVPVTIL